MGLFEKAPRGASEEESSQVESGEPNTELIGPERNRKTAEQLGIDIEGMSDEEIDVAVQKKLGEVLGK
jgi:hypothetical protein